MTQDTTAISSSFLPQYKNLLDACEDPAVCAKWEHRGGGPASTHVRNSLFSIALRTLSSDGVYEQAELDTFNALFGTNHTAESLEELSGHLTPFVGTTLEDEALATRDALDAASDGLGTQYADVALFLCQLLSQADGRTEWTENDLSHRLKEALS